MIVGEDDLETIPYKLSTMTFASTLGDELSQIYTPLLLSLSVFTAISAADCSHQMPTLCPKMALSSMYGEEK